jgi:hypothetical protein
MTKESMLSTCIEWLADWTADLPPIVDEYDLTEWLEEEGCESLELLLSTAFRKSKTRQEAIEILRGLVWEWYLSQRDLALAALPTGASASDAVPRLLALPQTPQKSAAWYAEARDLLTGHEFAGVVYGTANAFQTAMAKKCQPAMTDEDIAALPTESRIVYTSPLNAFQWGWRYEPVIRTLYEEEVAESPICDTLGRIRHPTLPRLAASPDGIIIEGDKAGRLLEIKAPVSRVLNGVIPQEYYCQMQLQAEVADVPAVEYIEVRFDAQPAATFTGGEGELSAEDLAEVCRKFVTPLPSNVSPQKPERMGAVLVIAPSEDASPETWTYAYSPIYALNEKGLAACLCWKPMDIPPGAVILEHSVWRIADWWTTTVPRNRRWWSEVGQPAYEAFWIAVDEARASGKYATPIAPASKYLIADTSSEGSMSETEDSVKKPMTTCLIASDTE